MDNLHLLRKLCLRLVFIVFFVTPYLFGCNGSPLSPPVDNPKDQTPSISPTVETSKTGLIEESPASPTLGREPTKATSLQPSNVKTISPTVEHANALSAEAPENEIIRKMIDQVSLDRALIDLRKLTGVEPICNQNNCNTITSRLTGSKGLRYAKDYVSEILTSQGYSVKLQDWSSSKWSDQNIIATKPGVSQPEEEIYLIAHLDGVGRIPLLHYPAADDNASGVVDILELSRIISHYPLNRTVVLLITTGEENGRLGSINYLNSLKPGELSAIKYAINIDMVGYDANKDKVMELWHGDHNPSKELVNNMSEIIKLYQLDLVPRFVVGCG